MCSGAFPPLPANPSAIGILAATGIPGANGSFPPNQAGDNLPSPLRFNREYAPDDWLAQCRGMICPNLPQTCKQGCDEQSHCNKAVVSDPLQ